MLASMLRHLEGRGMLRVGVSLGVCCHTRGAAVDAFGLSVSKRRSWFDTAPSTSSGQAHHERGVSRGWSGRPSPVSGEDAGTCLSHGARLRSGPAASAGSGRGLRLTRGRAAACRSGGHPAGCAPVDAGPVRSDEIGGDLERIFGGVGFGAALHLRETCVDGRQPLISASIAACGM